MYLIRNVLNQDWFCWFSIVRNELVLGHCETTATSLWEESSLTTWKIAWRATRLHRPGFEAAHCVALRRVWGQWTKIALRRVLCCSLCCTKRCQWIPRRRVWGCEAMLDLVCILGSEHSLWCLCVDVIYIELFLLLLCKSFFNMNYSFQYGVLLCCGAGMLFRVDSSNCNQQSSTWQDPVLFLTLASSFCIPAIYLDWFRLIYGIHWYPIGIQ